MKRNLLKRHDIRQLRKDKKGFTLVELMVVMAVVAVLVLLAAPRFIGQTKEANKTKLISNAKVLEDAAERYHIDHGKWPRGDEEPYTPEQVNDLAENIYEITGEEITLTQGNYWNIDYEALEPYAKLPDESEWGNYVLRNPIGKVYALEGLTDLGENRGLTPSHSEDSFENGGSTSKTENPITFYGLTPEAFDGDFNTSTSLETKEVQAVTWDGDLANREIQITGRTNYNDGDINLSFYGADGKVIIPVGHNKKSYPIITGKTAVTRSVVVPEGATKMTLSTNLSHTGLHIYEIKVPERLVRPSLSTVTSHTTDNSVELKWGSERRVRVFKDNILLTDETADSFVDKPLHSNTKHTYNLLFLDEYGNGASEYVTRVAQTDEKAVNFQGLTPDAFDGDFNTSTSLKTNAAQMVTWDIDLSNREIQITGHTNYSNGEIRLVFYGKDGGIIRPAGHTSNVLNIIIGDKKTTNSVVVPEGATKMAFSTSLSHTGLHIYEIKVPEMIQRPNMPKVMSDTTDNSITLTWSSLRRVRIFRDGMFIADTVASSYTDKPLYSNSKHTYNLLYLDEYGNGASEYVAHVAETDGKAINFRGLTPKTFDGDPNTSTSLRTNAAQTVTWDGNLANREIQITGHTNYSNGEIRLTFYGADGKYIIPSGQSSWRFPIIIGDRKTTNSVIVPEGATRMDFSTSLSQTGLHVYEIEVVN